MIPTLRFRASGEKIVNGTLPKNIEDHLNAFHVGKFNRFFGLFDLFHADAIVADFALLDQIIKDAICLYEKILHKGSR